MIIDISLIITLSTVITGLIVSLTALYTARKGARKDEMTSLRQLVDALSAKIETQEIRINQQALELIGQSRKILYLQTENLWLRSILVKNGIDIPPIPSDMLGQAEEDERRISPKDAATPDR